MRPGTHTEHMHVLVRTIWVHAGGGETIFDVDKVFVFVNLEKYSLGPCGLLHAREGDPFLRLVGERWRKRVADLEAMVRRRVPAPLQESDDR